MIDVNKISADSDDLKEAFDIRHEVFVVEQNVARDIEYEYEEESIHFLARIEGEPAGTARWRHTSEGIKLERFAVLAKFRGRGVASALIQRVLTDIGEVKEKIYLHSQESACSVYAKHKFEAVGPLFWEADIPHYKMVLSKNLN
jgi:predicted GNAT family N-acyltransferase